MEERPQTLGEEIANSISHGFGLLAAVVAAPILIVATARHGSAVNVAGASVFAATMVLLYFASTLYHALPGARAKAIFRRLDHGAIYLLIAGTYTPFTLGALRGSWGWSLAAIIWPLALLGILFKTTALGFRFHRTSVALYVGMGWLAVVAAKPLMRQLSTFELGWLVAGGLCYTLGVAFYVWKSRPYTHAIWHVFVLAGVACHFVTVLSITSG